MAGAGAEPAPGWTPAPALWSVLVALARAVRRDLSTFSAITLNNFFLFVALIVYGAGVSGVAPVGAYAFLILLGFVLLFPLAGDPLSKIPASRLALWPLRRLERFGLRVAALVFSPFLWIAGLVAWRASRSVAALGIFAAPLAGQVLAGRGWRPLRRVPGVGETMRKDLRQMLSVLDTWLAVLLAAAGAAGHARTVAGGGAGMAALVALALSTYAQCPFGLDGAGGRTRYALAPLPGWRIVLGKDAAYLLVLLVLVLPIDAAAGMAFGLTSLAVGRYPALRYRLPVERWRFTGGRVLFGVLQVGIGMAAALAAERGAAAALVVAGYAVSVWAGGRLWERV